MPLPFPSTSRGDAPAPAPFPTETEPEEMERLLRVYIHADESCLGNQFRDRDNPGGAAGMVEVWRRRHWIRRDYWTAEAGTTNNRMALRSAIVPLEALTRPCRVRFVSDSLYLVRGMREWVRGWKARGWTRKGGPLENAELWKTLDRAAARHHVQWAWVRGHAGHPQNEYADHLAVRTARRQDASGGLVESGFEGWLEEQRETHGKYLEYHEFLPADAQGLEGEGSAP